jgi:hypothetical protein
MQPGLASNHTGLTWPRAETLGGIVVSLRSRGTIGVKIAAMVKCVLARGVGDEALRMIALLTNCSPCLFTRLKSNNRCPSECLVLMSSGLAGPCIHHLPSTATAPHFPRRRYVRTPVWLPGPFPQRAHSPQSIPWRAPLTALQGPETPSD